MNNNYEEAIVEYHKDLNDVVFKDFKAVELNLFFAICTLIKNNDTKDIILDISEIKRIAQYKSRSRKRFEPDLINTIDKTKILYFSEYSSMRGQKINLFDMKKTVVDFDEKKLFISLTSRFSYILNDFNEHSIAFPISQFINLQSIYSKHLYRIFLQYEDDEQYTFSIESFRERLDLNEKYPYMKDMDRRVFKMINEELGTYYDTFKFEKILKQPQRVVGIKYIFYNKLK